MAIDAARFTEQARQAGYDDAAISQYLAQNRPKQVGGIKGFVARALPLIGGTAGAVLGTLAAPVAGTAAGGAAGAGAGAFLKQKILGEDTNLGEIGKEAALGAVPGVFRGVSGAVRGVKGAKAAKEAQAIEEANRAAQATARTGTIGRSAIGGTLSGQRAFLAQQADEATRFNDLARQNIQNLGKERATQGLPLPGGGVLVKPGATPSFASEGVELRPVPQVPEIPQRFAQPFGSTANPAPAAPTPAPAAPAKSGVIQRTKAGAQNTSQAGYGLTIGQSAGRGQVLTPDKADETYNFITNGAQKYGGIRPGKPIDQARDAQNVFNNVKVSLDETLAKIDRPLQVGEGQRVAAGALTKIADDPAVTGTTKTMDKFKTKLESAKNLKDLERIRREADDLAYSSTGAGKTSAAAQARAVREAIDDFITPMSPDYKAIKGDYTLARDALESTSKANKSAKGFKLPFVDTEIGKQAIPALKNKISAKLAGTPPPGTPPVAGEAPMGFRPFVKAGVQQAGTRLAVSPFLAQAQEDEQLPSLELPPQVEDTAAQPEQLSAFNDPEKVQQAYIQALMSGDKETAQLLLSGFEKFGQIGKEKPLSAEASKTVGTANSGLQSLQQLVSTIEQGGVPVGTVVPGRGLVGGAGQNLLGTAEYDTAADNVADAMVRLRTGAAATKEELQLYRRLLPQAFDSPEVQAQKIKQVQDYFNSVSNRTGTAGTDIQAALGI